MAQLPGRSSVIDSALIDNQQVRFVSQSGELIEVPLHVVAKNPVLRMLHQYTCPPDVIQVQDETRVFQNLVSHLQDEEIPLREKDTTEMLVNFRCAHKYQCYRYAIEILQLLIFISRSHNVLLLYSLLSTLPELPPSISDSGPAPLPSAPPIVQLQECDPEQAEFVEMLGHAHRHCLQLIDSRSAEVLASDALLSVPGEALEALARRDSLSAREAEIGRALLRWTRHQTLNNRLCAAQRRRLVLGALRLLTLSVKELRRLELERCGVLSREELVAILDCLLHGGGALPESLQEYEVAWRRRRAGPGRGRRGILQRIGGRSRANTAPAADRRVHFQPDEEDVLPLDRRNRRSERIKMALATGASILFD